LAFDAEDPWTGGTRRVEYEFTAPEGGGYLRETSTGDQMCERFASRGATLLWNGRGRLVDFLRAEYRDMRRAEARGYARDRR
jgi:hypothetical protein